jgi:hypothetical protein
MVWVRQIGQEGRPHYHFVLLLNKDAYHTVGRFHSGRENLYSRLQSARASALRISFEDADGLVHAPANPQYHLSHDDHVEMEDYFYRVSYLCRQLPRITAVDAGRLVAAEAEPIQRVFTLRHVLLGSSLYSKNPLFSRH